MSQKVDWMVQRSTQGDWAPDSQGSSGGSALLNQGEEPGHWQPGPPAKWRYRLRGDGPKGSLARRRARSRKWRFVREVLVDSGDWDEMVEAVEDQLREDPCVTSFVCTSP